jgi:hypothetical protein
VAHTVSRLRVGGRDQYRLDCLTRSGRNRAKTIACDGEHSWQVFAAQTMVGPAYPLPRDIANVVDSSWLLGCRLSGGAQVSYRGRRAYQLRVSRDGDGRDRNRGTHRRRRRPPDERRGLRHPELPGRSARQEP